MRHAKTLGLLAVASALAPATSQAVLAYAAKDVNLRAGPAREFPVVAVLQAGVALSIEGCLSDYRWCDVVAGVNRGWVYAGNIVYPYSGAYVPLLTYGAVIGIGVVTFSLGPYWERHYFGSPWYPQLPYWINRPWYGYGPGVRPPPPYRPGYAPPPPRHGHVPGGQPLPPYRPGHASGGPPPTAGGRPVPHGGGSGVGPRPPPGPGPGAGPRPPHGQGGGQHR